MTPRTKILITLCWINFFLFFFKFHSLLNTSFYWNSFFSFFFSKNFFNFFYKLKINLSGNYMNKFTITSVFWNFQILNNFLNNSQFINKKKFLHKNFIFNTYFLSIKIINIKITKTYLKKFFFFIVFFLSDVWYQFHNNIKYYLNFFFIKKNLKFYNFYNGYFLNVRNF